MMRRNDRPHIALVSASIIVPNEAEILFTPSNYLPDIEPAFLPQNSSSELSISVRIGLNVISRSDLSVFKAEKGREGKEKEDLAPLLNG